MLYKVYLIFIALQCCGPFVALLLNSPSQVQRSNGKQVELSILENPWNEFKETTKRFLTKEFLLLDLWIGQAVYSESVYYSYIALWFSVRARALGSFLSGIVAVVAGILLGVWLDQNQISLHKRARRAYAVIMTLHGAWWIWLTINATEFRRKQPTHDWGDPGFGRAFGVFVFLMAAFQFNYNFAFFVIGQLSTSPQETIRLAALLRGTESAWQALSNGLNAIPVFASVGGAYFNFGLWGLSLVPAWLVIRGVWDGQGGGVGRRLRGGEAEQFLNIKGSSHNPVKHTEEVRSDASVVEIDNEAVRRQAPRLFHWCLKVAFAGERENSHEAVQIDRQLLKSVRLFTIEYG